MSNENTITEITYTEMPSGYIRKSIYRGTSYDIWGNGNAEHIFLTKEEYEKEIKQ